VLETEIRNNNTNAITVLHSLDAKLIGGVTVETHYGDVIDHLSLAIACNAAYETVKVLCDLVNVNTVSSWNQSTPMHQACYHHRLDVLQLLISRGAAAVAPTWSGWHPMHSAIMRYYQTTAPMYMQPEALATAKLAVQRYVQEQHAKGLCVNVAVAKRPCSHGHHYTDDMQQLTEQLLIEAINTSLVATSGVRGTAATSITAAATGNASCAAAAAAATAASGAVTGGVSCAAAGTAAGTAAVAGTAAAAAASSTELVNVVPQQLYTPLPDILADVNSTINYANDAGNDSSDDLLQEFFEQEYKRQRVADI
jgi:ankyrin repeat protein